MSESEPMEWPREIWMAERDELDQGVVSAVLSEHATVARWEGDEERDRDFHRYVDADIHDSAERYHAAKRAELDSKIERLRGALEEIRDSPCMDPEGNTAIARAALLDQSN